MFLGATGMYRISREQKRDAQRRWALPDRVFFACGACHILAYAVLRRYSSPEHQAIWIKPAPGFTGNHIIVATARWAFDYHGYRDRSALLDHMTSKARRWWPEWRATLVELAEDILISEEKSKAIEGLWLREPQQFLQNALPRAEAFINRFGPPPSAAAVVGQNACVSGPATLE